MTNNYNIFSIPMQASPTQEPLDNGNIASPSHHDDLDDLDVHEPRENAISPQDAYGNCDMATPEEKILKV